MGKVVSFLKTVGAIALFAAFLLGLSMYVAPPSMQKAEWRDYRVYVPPNRNLVTLKVQWGTEEQVRLWCDGAVGCMKAVQDEMGNYVGVPLVIVPKPANYNDKFAMIILGHEVLHVLGAYHD